MSRKQRKVLLRIIVAFVFLIVAIITEKTQASEIISSVVYLTSYFIIGYDVIVKAVWGVRNRRFMDENFLMSVASVGAVIMMDFMESVAVMLFYQIGELFQSYAVGKSRKSIASLMDIRPETARVIRDGQAVTVSPYEVRVEEILEVNPGEKIPLDGVVMRGSSCLNTSAMTGESAPLDVTEGSSVLAGFINMDAVIEIKVTKPFSQSSVAKILELVENASQNKSKSEKFITKFSKWYTPIVLIAAIILAVVPQFFISSGRIEWIRRALIFLVISCPCALVISVPLTFFSGIGSASKKGILVKGSGILEQLALCDTVVFDKTGTLTKGDFAVSEVVSEKFDQRVLLAVCAAAEQHSNHPVARAIVTASAKDFERFKVTNVREVAGKGVIAVVERWEVAAGNRGLMEMLDVDYTECESAGTAVYVAIDGKYAGHISVSDQIKETAYGITDKLIEQEIEDIIMLTGDLDTVAQKVADQLKIEKVYAGLLPEQKVEVLESIITSNEGKVVFAGDGINDAAVLVRADIGIAMGALGSDAAIEAADVVLTDDNIEKIPVLLRIAKNTCEIAKQNIAFAVSVKLLFLMLGAFGATGMAGAVFADVGVAIIAILNAMRALRSK